MLVRVPVLCGFGNNKDGHGLWFAGGTRERKITLKAEDVDDCCEWVIGIREEIASKTVK